MSLKIVMNGICEDFKTGFKVGSTKNICKFDCNIHNFIL